jgi:hypothetical protein
MQLPTIIQGLLIIGSILISYIGVAILTWTVLKNTTRRARREAWFAGYRQCFTNLRNIRHPHTLSETLDIEKEVRG